MGTKHDILTENELAGHEPSAPIVREIESYLASNANQCASGIRVLDWGCGRGKSVAALNTRGIDTWGTEIDEPVMRRGFEVFSKWGLNPEERLLSIDGLRRIPDGFFDVIYSEQVLEHVSNLDGVVREMARVTRPNGIGIHAFPGALNVEEGHLFMPFVHWIPKFRLRKWAIFTFLACGYGPDPPWPELVGKTIGEKSRFYYSYLNERTFYRSIGRIHHVFLTHGFRAEETPVGGNILRRIKTAVRKNGFPKGQMLVKVRMQSKFRDEAK